MRELEQQYGEAHEQTRQDFSWLVSQLRRNHHALYQILAASQELDGAQPVVKKLRHFANEALGLYPTANDAPTRTPKA